MNVETWTETYEFPGWDRCMRCLCHMRDECPDLEYLYSLQQQEDEWNSLSDEEKAAISDIEIGVYEKEPVGEDWPF